MISPATRLLLLTKRELGLMSDIYDDASDTEALHREMAIKEIRSHKPLKTTGFCLSCNAPLPDRKFCDTWCREDYEMEIKIKKITGKS